MFKPDKTCISSLPWQVTELSCMNCLTPRCVSKRMDFHQSSGRPCWTRPASQSATTSWPCLPCGNWEVPLQKAKGKNCEQNQLQNPLRLSTGRCLSWRAREGILPALSPFTSFGATWRETWPIWIEKSRKLASASWSLLALASSGAAPRHHVNIH